MTPSAGGDPAVAQDRILEVFGETVIIRRDPAGQPMDAAVVEEIVPLGVGAPLHRHSREDEYSFVLEGRMGADLGGDIVVAGPGDLVFKPRAEWHTFWNAGDEPCRILEIISPGGFERYFEELIDFLQAPTRESVAPVAAKYGLEIDPASIPVLCERHGLRFAAEERA
jgi:mannose-6-phosphate isomerase-like protein (cupin superfamily)